MYLTRLKPASRTWTTTSTGHLWSTFRRMPESLQLWRRSWIGSSAITKWVDIPVRTSLMLPTAPTYQTLSWQTTAACRIRPWGNRNQTDPVMYPLSNPGTKLSRCSPPAKWRACTAPLTASTTLWALLRLLRPTCPCLPAPPVLHSSTSSIHTPSTTATSPGQLTRCPTRWPLPRTTCSKIQVNTSTSGIRLAHVGVVMLMCGCWFQGLWSFKTSAASR